jgi:D-glycero-D-manno-heptose 1,7-bisphosphate phosphatase
MSDTTQGRQAVFIDRDGTLNVEKGYIRVVDELALLPGAARAIKQLNEAGILAILTTNQTGAARGFYPLQHIHDLHERLAQLLWTEADAKLDAIFSCPHLAKGTVAEYAIDCTCRKPERGMIDQALLQFPDIDLQRSYVIGDKASDVAFGYNAGAIPLLVTTGYGDRVITGKYQSLDRPPVGVYEHIGLAVRAILDGTHKPPAYSRVE